MVFRLFLSPAYWRSIPQIDCNLASLRPPSHLFRSLSQQVFFIYKSLLRFLFFSRRSTHFCSCIRPTFPAFSRFLFTYPCSVAHPVNPPPCLMPSLPELTCCVISQRLFCSISHATGFQGRKLKMSCGAFPPPPKQKSCFPPPFYVRALIKGFLPSQASWVSQAFLPIFFDTGNYETPIDPPRSSNFDVFLLTLRLYTQRTFIFSSGPFRSAKVPLPLILDQKHS